MGLGKVGHESEKSMLVVLFIFYFLFFLEGFFINNTLISNVSPLFLQLILLENTIYANQFSL